MGCNIHFGVQIRVFSVEDGSEFVTVCRGFEYSDYDLFALLAGVRNYHNVTPLSQPRGLPKDLGLCKLEGEGNISLVADEEHRYHPKKTYNNWHSSAAIWMGVHSHTWFTLNEFDNFKCENELFMDFLNEIRNYCKTYCIATTEIRFVIGFDG